MAGRNLYDLVVSISVDIASLNVGLAAANDSVSRFARESSRGLSDLTDRIGAVQHAFEGLAALSIAGLGLDQFKGMIEGAIDAQASLQDLAVKVGTTAERLSALTPAATLSGTSMDTVAHAAGLFAKNLIGVQDGTSKASAAFKSLGFSAKDAARFLADPTQGLLELAQHLNTFADDGSKTAAVLALLGKGGQELLPFLKRLGDQLDVTATVTNEQAKAAHDLEDAWRGLTVNADALKNQVAAALVPAFQQILATVASSHGAVQTFVATVKGMAQDGSLAEWALRVAEAIAVFGESLAAIVRTLHAFSGSVDVVFADVRGLAAAFKYAATASNPFASKETMAAGAAKFQAALDKRTATLADANKRWSDLWNSNKTALSDALDAELKKMEAFNAAAGKQAAAALAAQQNLAKNADARDIALFGSAAQAPGAKPSTGYSNATLSGIDQFTTALLQANKVIVEAQIALNNLGVAAQDQAAPALKSLADIMLSPAWAAYSASQQQRIVNAYEEAAAIQRTTAAQKAALDLQTQAAVEKINASYRDFLGSIDRANQGAQRQIDLLGKAPDVIARSNAEYQAQVVLQREINQLTNDWIEATAKGQTAQADAILANLNDILARQGQIVRSAGDLAVKYEQAGVKLEAWKGLFTSLADEGATFIENFVTKGSSAFKTLWDDFRTWALQAFAKIAAQTIVVNLAAALAPSAAGIASSTFAGGGNGLMSLLTGGSNVVSGLSNFGALTGLTSLGSGGIFAAGGALSGFATGTIGQALGLSTTVGVNASLGAATAGLTAFGSAMGAVIPVLGAVVAVAGLLGAFDHKPSPVKGQFMVSPGTSGFEDNAYVPSAFGNLGFNDSNTQQFSGDAAKVFDTVVAGAIDAFNTRFSPEQSAHFAEVLKNMTFKTFEGTFTTQDFLQKYGGQVLQQVVTAAFQELDPALASVMQGFKGTADQVSTFANTLLGVYDHLKNIGNADFTATVDAALQGATQASADKVAAFVTIVDDFGAALPGVGAKLEALTASDIPGFIDALGGAQAALNTFSYLQQNFLTSAERTQQATALLSADFAKLGLAVPASHQAFLDLLNSIDLTSDSGKKLYASIAALAPLFVQVRGTADQAASAVSSVNTALQQTTAIAGQVIVSVGQLQDAGRNAAQTLLNNVQALANASTGDFGDKLSTQISLIADAARKVPGGIVGASGIAYSGNSDTDAAYLATLGGTYAQMTDELARFTVLTAQYGDAQAEQLVQLQDWYTKQQKIFGGGNDAMVSMLQAQLQQWEKMKQSPYVIGHEDTLKAQITQYSGNVSALSALDTIFKQKWDAIVNGTASGVGGVQDALSRLQQSIAQYLQGLVVSAKSPLTPLQQLAQAASAYSSELAKAQGGDQGALGDITKFADAYLGLARNAFASSGQYTAIFDAVTSDLGQLAGTDQTGLPVGTRDAAGLIASALPPQGGALASSQDLSTQTTVLASNLDDVKQLIAMLISQTKQSSDAQVAEANRNAAVIVDGLGGTLR